MDFDSSSKFIASLAKFLQSLCNGYVDFDKGVEVIGHIYINVDSDTGKKVDYVLNEKVCKNDNSITFISNSFHAQPAEKPKPPPKKTEEPDRQNNETFIMEDSGPPVPNSTNVGTLGPYRSPSARTGQQDSYPVGSKRPRSPPLQRSLMGKSGSPAVSKLSMPPSPRYHDSGGPGAKMGRSDILPSPLNSGSLGGSGDDYEGANVFQGGDEDDNFSTSFLDNQNSSEVDQKPVIDPDISIVKEEYMSNQSSCSYSGINQTSGPGRGKGPPASAYPVMLHQSPSNYAAAAGSTAPPPDLYAGNLDGVGDPSTLTRAQQEELEMYYRKGTDQHLTFLPARVTSKLKLASSKTGVVAKRKQTGIDLQTKLKILEEVDSGTLKKTKIAEQYGIAKSTISTILKGREKILSAAASCSWSKSKRLRGPKYEEIEMLLIDWFNHMRASNIPLSGPIIQSKADEIAKNLGIQNFSCSSGWLYRFQKRHSISALVMSGEATQLDEKGANNCSLEEEAA